MYSTSVFNRVYFSQESAQQKQESAPKSDEEGKHSKKQSVQGEKREKKSKVEDGTAGNKVLFWALLIFCAYTTKIRNYSKDQFNLANIFFVIHYLNILTQ